MNMEIFEFLEDITLYQKTSVFLGIKYLGLLIFGLSFCLFFYLAVIWGRQPTPDEVFKKKLAELYNLAMEPLPEYKKFFFEYVALLKFYVKSQLFINLDACTDLEILSELKREGFDFELLTKLRPILDQAYVLRFSENTDQKVSCLESLDWLKAFQEHILVLKKDFKKSLCKKTLN